MIGVYKSWDLLVASIRNVLAAASVEGGPDERSRKMGGHTQQGCRGPSPGPGVPPRLFIGLPLLPWRAVSCFSVPLYIIHFPCSFSAHSRNLSRGLARDPAAQGGTGPSPRPRDTLMGPAVLSLEICPAETPGRKTRICRK